MPENKVTAEMPTVEMPIPETIVLPMQQHVGALCKPVVKRGDHVDVGTLVGHADKALAADIFSSVSGTVTGIVPAYYSSGKTDQTVVIATDGLQTVDPHVVPPEVHDKESFLEAMNHSGIVGLGGAGFPTDIKLAPKNLDEIETLVVNGAECEPYLSSDYREMIENADDILFGLRSCMKYLDIPKGIIAIEENKPKAIEHLTKLTQDDPTITVRTLPSMYPQGAHHILLYNMTGKEVPRGQRSTVIGAMIFNVTTISKIGLFLRTGMPLVTRRITVAGDAVERPANVQIAIGTRIHDLMDFCGLKKEPRKVVMGGPMMGNAVVDLGYPVVRQNSGLLVFADENVMYPESTPCIKCGRCVRSCPMRLNPVGIQNAYNKNDLERMDYLKADMCISCGTCSYVCPAKQPLTQTTKLARNAVRAEQRKQRKKRA